MNDKRCLSFIIYQCEDYLYWQFRLRLRIMAFTWRIQQSDTPDMFYIPTKTHGTLAVPAPLMTSEPESFAYNTFKVRVPRIIDEIVALNHFKDEVISDMRLLRDEITDGRIRQIREITPDQMFWNKVSDGWLGRTWLEVPWYWAETCFYRRVLEATRYFQPGDGYLSDPYTPHKMTELEADSAPRILDMKLAVLPVDRAERFTKLIENSLWGNRTDLSYNVANTLDSTDRNRDETANLIVNDTRLVMEMLLSGRCHRVAVITDNAGTELLMDLALVDYLLEQNVVEHIELYLKEQPFFVSDAMPKDVHTSIRALSTGSPILRNLATRLDKFITAGRLTPRQHWFFTTCLFYTQLPDDLRADLTQADLVILKGDANYRRLLSDAHWQPTASFILATDYFPAPFVALRTLKAELITGLPDGLAERLTQQDLTWRVNGKRGVIQANLHL